MYDLKGKELFYEAIWELFASGYSVEEIEEAVSLLDADYVDEVKKDFDDEEK